MDVLNVALLVTTFIGALVGAIAVLFYKSSTLRAKRWPLKAMILAAATIIIGAIINMWLYLPVKVPVPASVRILNSAWAEYNAKKYRQAIAEAENCIEEFESLAIKDLRRLERDRAPLPAVGKVSEDEKRKIFEQGLVNDVGTCWFIKARSLEKLKRKQEAIEAYCEAARYSYARTYDAMWDGFWSPAEAAIDRVSQLGSTCK